MSIPFHRAWEEVLAKLSDLLLPSGSETRPACLRTVQQVLTLLNMLKKMPEQPDKLWVAVICDLRVPKQLGQMWCSSALAQEPQQHLDSPLLLLFLDAVSCLLFLAQVKMISHREKASNPQHCWRVQIFIQQQMLHSGLLQALAELQTAVALQLEMWNAAGGSGGAAAETSGQCGSSSKGNSSLSSSGSSSSTATGQGQPSRLHGPADLPALHAAAVKLASVQAQLQMLFDSGSLDADVAAAAVSCASAALHLTVAACRNITVYVKQQQQQQQGSSSLIWRNLPLLVSQTSMAIGSMAASCRGTPDLTTEIRRSPHYVEWTVLAVIVAMYAAVLQQQQCLPEVQGLSSAHQSHGSDSHDGVCSSSSSSSRTSISRRNSSSRSANSRKQQPKARQPSWGAEHRFRHELQAWQEAQGQWSSLPPSHTQLLEQLGSSVPAAVWLAAMYKHAPIPAPEISDCLVHLQACNLLEEPGAAVVGHTCTPQHGATLPVAEAMQLERQQQQQQQQQHSAAPAHPVGQLPLCTLDLLPAVLLYGATHIISSSHPERSTEANITMACHLASLACVLAHDSAERAHQQLLNLLGQQQQQQQQHAAQSSSSQAELAPAAVAEYVLLSLKVLEQLQPLLSKSLGTAASKGQPQVRAGVVTNISNLPQTLPPTKVLSGTETVLTQMLRVYVALLPCGEASTSLTATDSTGVCDVSPVLAHNVARVCRTLEAFVRHQGALPEELQDSIGVQKAMRSAAAGLGSSAEEPLLTMAAAAGPGSQLQLQLFSLWSSALKWGSVLHLYDGLIPIMCADTALLLLGPPHGMAAEQSAAAVATAAAPEVAASAAHGGTSSRSSISSSAAGAITSSSTSSTVYPWLMWLVLLGRCCLQWCDGSQALLFLAHTLPKWQQMILPHRAGQGAASNACQVPASGAGNDNVSAAFPQDSPRFLRQVVDAVQRVLGPNSHTAQQMSACGYAADSATDAAAGALVALDRYLASDAADGSSNPPETLQELIAAVEALGQALTSLAVPHCCNNPGCLNISGPSDVVLVSGKSCICGRCKVARYCGKACQQQHWRLHKPVCKALAAPQAAAQVADTIGQN